MEKHSPIKRSVDSLERIYSVVIALALGQTFNAFFLYDETNMEYIIVSDPWQSTIVFIAFIFTLVPFYYGMNRHLDVCYIEKQDSHTQGALLVDFGVFFIESILLLSCSYTMKSGLTPFIILGILLSFDMVWAFISDLIHYKEITPGIKKWAIINFITIIAGLLIYFTNAFTNTALILMILLVARSFADYAFNWSFYFPLKTVESA